MSLIKNLINSRENLSVSERTILDYIMNKKIAISNFSVEKIAEATFTSPASVVRMCKKIGFSGFKDFKVEYILAKSKTDSIRKQVLPGDLFEETDFLGPNIIKQHIKTLKDVLDNFDQLSVKKAAEIIMNAKRIIIFGKGSSYLISKDLELKLKMLGKFCIANHELHSQMIDQAFMSDKDLVILISYSGKTKEVISAALVAKEQRTKIIGITSDENSLLAELSDHLVITLKSQEGLYDQESVSRISQLCIIDSINAECILYEHQEAFNNEKRIFEIFKKYVR